ncbi:aminodeoxychorismate synthase component I [Geotalea sp. SG265]|uniref:aminodeoxychorismate synthase component I n=1 Tax=Geotalea sp. SG265 TaxID=2922867 RepID=UPI001FAF5376|nr:aminodeoxychorismate synthase component I [Geotalea sp. SG265]
MHAHDNHVLIRDCAADCWLHFDRPVEVVQAHAVAEVLSCLRYVEEAVDRRGLYAAGMVAYEAAPAFDPALQVRPDDSDLPILWFGLYHGPQQATGFPPSESTWLKVPWLATVSPEAYRSAFEQIKEHIKSGDTYQVNYTYRLRGPSSTATIHDFLGLLQGKSAPFGAAITTKSFSILSASPELFFSLDGEMIESRPMKGTIARGLTQEEDWRQGQALQNSEKDRAENLMIVDMVRNDLGRIAETGSVHVPRLFTLEKYPTLWQMTSSVRGRTRASVTDIFAAMFPAASITGAPKNQAMQIIANLETSPRRIYTGSIGFIAPGRRAQFNVAIRSMLFSGQENAVEYGTGGGIVWDSQWQNELAESRTKAAVLRARPVGFSLLESILWTPEERYRLLEHHLKRMAQSAAYFDYSMAEDDLRRHLADLSRRLQPFPHKVRLLLEQDGTFTSQVEPLIQSGDTSPKEAAVAPFPVDKSDPFLYHKTTCRDVYRRCLAACSGYDDVIMYNGDGEVTESTIANVVVDLHGVLCTPPVQCGLLPGTFRQSLLEMKRIEERIITLDQLHGHDVYLINSVRGMYRVKVAPPIS